MPTSPHIPYVVIDLEVSLHQGKVMDGGALRFDGAQVHCPGENCREKILTFIGDESAGKILYLCGHNIIHHDIRYLLGDADCPWTLVDTLYLSPLLFPKRPYHRLVKDDKIQSDDVNNPLSDCLKARDLLMEEITAWNSLPQVRKTIYASLLGDVPEFSGFLAMVGAEGRAQGLDSLILSTFEGAICANAPIPDIIASHPCELAYALSLIESADRRSITPAWVLHAYPGVENVMKVLRGTPCHDAGCPYCRANMDIHAGLKEFFGYDAFRTYEGEPLQENAVRAAVEGKSLLAIFPTGGGKSLTFQLPALMEGKSVHGLTVVISPLQSLMKDQVDNLSGRGITDAVTVNGLLDPISRANCIARVMDGDASILYISPEMLRSRTIGRILLGRNVTRFVIDEAHCFSSWGQDFRVDYLYIGKFIREYMEKKGSKSPIPVSCFTATAKQKVIQDISDYFGRTLGVRLELFASTATRTNLRYRVVHAETPDEKRSILRNLLSEHDCPTIIYVSRTRRTVELSEQLSQDGIPALPFNGRMTPEEKTANQDSFMSGRTKVIVATSAFGMGVDKKDIGLVVHYDISDSLENYVQEAGRAGRDPGLSAECYVLYSDHDLDGHFLLLNQSKLSFSEIQQVWKGVKDLTRGRESVSCSALEIARSAGWGEGVHDVETRVRTAISVLEQGGYLERGYNVPKVFATGIKVRNVDEARTRITDSPLFGKEEVETAVRIIRSLISSRSISRARGDDAESRVDYLADVLGLEKQDVISAVERMRQAGILADSRDMTVFLPEGDTRKRSLAQLERFLRLEEYILRRIPDGEGLRIVSRQLNDDALRGGIPTSSEKDIRTVLYFLAIGGYVAREENMDGMMTLRLRSPKESVQGRYALRADLCRSVLGILYDIAGGGGAGKGAVEFSEVEVLSQVHESDDVFSRMSKVTLAQLEESLLYLSKIGVMRIEGGFMVLYNAMDIRRLKDSRFRYRQDDYRMLNEFYRQKIQQIHIVGEYANLMVRDYGAALQYVSDYFRMDYRKFISKYFKGDKAKEIEITLTPGKYARLFGDLSDTQRRIISDRDSRCIVVAAGPGSGKTRVLVHKLASLLLLEDVKGEQLLMLTFSRAAATEFKTRLTALIGPAAHYVQIKTFHSYAFDLMGRVGNIEDAGNIVERAAAKVRDGETEPGRIAKSVLVIDEAQDMGPEDYALVRALMAANEGMRVIAVGDDDQNIFGFRGADSSHLYGLVGEEGATLVEMTENFRSCPRVVDTFNSFAGKIPCRLKRGRLVSRVEAEGEVTVTRYSRPGVPMYIPLAREVGDKFREGGSTCVLTRTNEEAAILEGLLSGMGIPCRLVQSMDKQPVLNMMEAKHFLKHLEKASPGPAILEEAWNGARDFLRKTYGGSTALPYLEKCLDLFSSTTRTKYMGDLREYMSESRIEDFGDFGGDEVVVSTIHKAKGNEFDRVFMMVGGGFFPDGDELRCLYVGMTRARRFLHIHTSSNIFDTVAVGARRVDPGDYPLPGRILLQLTHRDVNLSSFAKWREPIFKLRSGDPLRCEGAYLAATSGVHVAFLSRDMQGKLAQWREQGYTPSGASVRFIVAWREKNGANDSPEIPVVLPDITLQREEVGTDTGNPAAPDDEAAPAKNDIITTH